jgi:parvulin-like peptidyl-prolyl isomerase
VRRLRGIAALVLVIALVGALAGCTSTSAGVVARVNGEDITQAEFDRLYEQVVAQFGGELPEDQVAEYRKLLLDMMIESELMQQEAERLGADLSAEAVEAGITSMMGADTDMAAFEARVTEAGLTMDDLRSSVRDQLARDFLSEYAASQGEVTALAETYSLLEHILVDDEALATELVGRIEAGEDFNALASEHSTDPGSGAEGGSLGWAPTSAYVAEFADAADALAIGGVSAPVQSEFGWHIIRKVDERAEGSSLAEAPDELKQAIEANGGDLALQEYVAGLRETAEIEYIDETLAP